MSLVKSYKIGTLIPHVDNPRMIDTNKFNTLVQSIKELPEMLNVRPLIIDMDNNIICGNMRYLACKELGLKEVPAKQVDLTEQQVKELMVKDNLSFGEWDYSMLEKDWDLGLFDKWMGKEQVDYSALEYEDLDDEMDSMHDGVKHAIQIVINPNSFDKAKELEHKCRADNQYIGGLFLNNLRALKLQYENSKSKTN
tara:strand:- start:418 stop:1005 length:588 start_codon:yes stop_codon:yes gene_type:complete